MEWQKVLKDIQEKLILVNEKLRYYQWVYKNKVYTKGNENTEMGSCILLMQNLEKEKDKLLFAIEESEKRNNCIR